jgi:hypothetical protein
MLDLLLADGDGTATSLSEQLPVTRQAIAKHLGVLDRVSLVHATTAGQERRYRVDEAQLLARSLSCPRWGQRGTPGSGASSGSPRLFSAARTSTAHSSESEFETRDSDVNEPRVNVANRSARTR